MESDGSGLETAVAETEESAEIEPGESENNYEPESVKSEYKSRDNFKSSDTGKERIGKSKKETTIEDKAKNHEKEAEQPKVYAAECMSFRSPQNPICAFYESVNESESGGKNTDRGAAAIIYNRKSGEFYLELKPDSYRIKEARGKLALVGGYVETSDAASLDALIREICEEVTDKKAQKILVNKLTQLGTYYHTIVEFIGGRRVETDVYLINVEFDKEWETVKNSALAEGTKQVLKYDELRYRLNDFAFKYEEPLIKLINEQFNKSSLHGHKVYYVSPIISHHSI